MAAHEEEGHAGSKKDDAGLRIFRQNLAFQVSKERGVSMACHSSPRRIDEKDGERVCFAPENLLFPECDVLEDVQLAKIRKRNK